MRKLIVFNQLSLDGYFVDRHGDMSWAKSAQPDPEFQAFVEGNAQGGGVLLFGRKTYDLMLQYWPSPLALAQAPIVAEQMNALPKIVFSRTLAAATWQNTTLMKGDIAATIREMKRAPGPDMVLLGSGSIIAQLAPERLIDEYQLVICPLVLGAGRTLFEGVTEKLPLQLTRTRAFANGHVLLCYTPME